ncbi:MAG: class I adenylate-forming enzyme family protein [Syntrophales bacterium]
MGKPVDYSIFKEVWDKEYTITRQLYRTCLKWPDKIAIIDPFRNRNLSFRQWDEEANQFANALLDAGVTTYDSVMGDLFNTYEWFILLMGCAKARCKFPSMNFMLPEGQVCKLIDDSEVVVFVYDSTLKDMAVKAVEMANVKPKVCIMCGPGEPPKGHVSYEKFIAGKPKTPPKTEKDVSWLDPVLGLYTSGTTGLPKGFTLNHGIIFFDNMMNAALHKIDDQCVTLATNPLFHRGGNTTGVLPVLHCGGAVVVMRSFDENAALDLIEKHKVTHMVSAPVIYERMCQAQEKKPRNVSSLRALTSMGSPLDKESCLRCMRILCPGVYNGYGTADQHWVTMLKPWELPERAGTIGLAITEDIIKLVRIDLGRRGDPNRPEDECPKDGKTEGEIALRTMHGCYGYINRPEDEAKGLLYRGWQLPGDTAVWDKDGYITICGRMDDMIITGAENVHPVVVEDALKDHPGVLDVFVTGAPSKEWGETIVAYVALKDPKVTEKDLEEFCKNSPRLARYQRPRYYKFVDVKELPFNPSGKKLHYVIKERAKKDFPNLP